MLKDPQVLNFHDYLFKIGVNKSKLKHERLGDFYYIQYAKLEFDTFCIIAHEDIVSSANDLREFAYFFNSGLEKILKDKYNFPVEHIFPKNSKNLYLLGSSFFDDNEYDERECLITDLALKDIKYNLSHAAIEWKKYENKEYGEGMEYIENKEYMNKYDIEQDQKKYYRILNKYGFKKKKLKCKILNNEWGKIHFEFDSTVSIDNQKFIWEVNKEKYIFNFNDFFKSTKNKKVKTSEHFS